MSSRPREQRLPTQPGSYLDMALAVAVVLATAGAPCGVAAQGVQTEPDGHSEAVRIDLRLSAAQDHYAVLNLEEAQRAIDEVIARLTTSEAEGWTGSARADAYVLAAAIARARGDLEASDGALDQALSFEPRLLLDPALHAPPLLEALERRRALLPRGDVATVAVVTPAAPAWSVVEPAPGIPLVIPEETEDTADPWPWVGLGAGVVVIATGVIALTVTLSAAPTTFDVRGTIVP